MKKCTDCKELKDETEFDHHRAICIPCRKARQKVRRDLNAEPKHAREPESGLYLHMSGETMTGSLDYAWQGTTGQFDKICGVRPEFESLNLVPVRELRR